jgi:hypothetical protein
MIADTMIAVSSSSSRRCQRATNPPMQPIADHSATDTSASRYGMPCAFL